MTVHFDASTAEETIGDWILSGPPAEELLSLLPEQHPLYAGRGTNETVRIRGFILAAFERTGLPDDAIEYALEELESGLDPYLVAAASRALRGARPDPRYVPFLRKAQRNVRNHDVPVTFDVIKPRWPFANATSALEEIRATLAWLGTDDAGEIDCCGLASPPARARRTIDPRIELEDQDGRTIRFGDYFRGTMSVVAFFYTRCDNPEKCSLTIAKLARLQEAIESGPLHGRVRIAAITYDPQYDLPKRLKLFGENRGIRFNDDVRFFRACTGHDDLRTSFDLGVNFAGSLVNRHRIELYVLDPTGQTIATFSRMQWDIATVITELQSQLTPASQLSAPSQLTSPSLLTPPPPRPRWHSLLTPIPALFLALLPKCPLCLAAYLSALGLGGLQTLLRNAWTIPFTITLLLTHLWLIHRRTRQTRDTTPLALAGLGTLALLAGSVLWDIRPIAIAGAVVLAGASIIGTTGMWRFREGTQGVSDPAAAATPAPLELDHIIVSFKEVPSSPRTRLLPCSKL